MVTGSPSEKPTSLDWRQPSLSRHGLLGRSGLAAAVLELGTMQVVEVYGA
jgi:hypothetical protein